MAFPGSWFSSGYLGPGSSGYWAEQDSLASRPGVPRPGYGYPGDRWRGMAGYTPLDPGMRQAGNNTSPVNINFHLNGQPQPGSNYSPSTVSNVKSPAFQSSINTALGGVNATGYNPNVNPNVLRDNTKNPAIQAAMGNILGNINNAANPRDFTKSGEFQQNINQAYQQAGADKTANRNQFGNFLGLFNSQTPGVTSNVNQENAALGNWWDTGSGGVGGQLEANAANWQKASRALTDQALQRVMKNNALLRMTQGDSSYATQQALDTSGRLAATQAEQEAQLRRNNLLTVLQGQAQYNGLRNQNLGYLANRQLQPINILQQLGGNEDARLAGIGQMDLSNNIYTTPAEQAQQKAAILAQLTGLNNENNVYTLDSPQNNLSRQISMLGALQQLNNQNNFYGLSKPYDPNNTGYFQQPQISTPSNNFANYALPRTLTPESLPAPSSNFGRNGYHMYDNNTNPLYFG